MKKTLSLIMAGFVLLFQAGSAFALSKTFTVSATIPTASTIGIEAYTINTATPTVRTGTGLALSFDPMTFRPTTSIWLPDHFFAIDVTTTGGTGGTDVTMTYADGANPNSSNAGRGALGTHAMATFMGVVGNVETAVTGHPKKLLENVNGEHITAAQLGNSLLRVYLGIVTGDPTASEPTGAQVFTNQDRPGIYDGQFAITATVS